MTQQLDQHLFRAATSGSHGYNLQLQTIKSTTNGVRYMYDLYREKKWQQIQELSSLILNSASSSEESAIPNDTEESSPRGRQLQQTDTTTQEVTEEFGLLYRNC